MRLLRILILGSLPFVLLLLTVLLARNSASPEPVVQSTQVRVVKPPTTSEVISGVNQERIIAGESTLSEDARLDASAEAKCKDMLALKYFEHNRPDGTTPWHFISEQGVEYRKAAENQEYGYMTSQDVIAAFMNSPGHKANILNPNYDTTGAAVCHADHFMHGTNEYLVVQHFVQLSL